MAKIVLGVGTSHSPLLTFTAERWMERAADDQRNESLTLSDGRTLGYDALLVERGPVHEHAAKLENLAVQAARTQEALDYLVAAIEQAAPDVVLVIGDDQEELYKAGNTPALAIYYGEEVVMRPLGEIMQDPPPWLAEAIDGYAMERENRFPGAPEFAERLIEALMDNGVDLGVASTIADSRAAAFGHAYGFVARRLLKDRPVPIVPILLNTYYPPNVIRPARCFDIGRRIATAVEQIPGDLRIAVIASGGLSHFVTDEALDLQVLDALRAGDVGRLVDLPMDALRSGSSEILCWIMAGGAFHHLQHRWSDYIPVYRTPAGTGVGLAFGIWG